MSDLKQTLLVGAVAVLTLAATALAAQEQAKPNILVIWGDDIGWYNISAYNLGVMGYRTPNIDRIAKEGALFTDWYGQQSCTAGRAAFVTGQAPVRTGLTKVGLPGAELGLQEEDPTIAGLLKTHGYMTGQYGKNHLGDLDARSRRARRPRPSASTRSWSSSPPAAPAATERAASGSRRRRLAMPRRKSGSRAI
jgi:arylsulfatase A-like enzyme